MWDIRPRRRWWFGKLIWQLGWLNRAGFGPIDEFDTEIEAIRALHRMSR